MPAYIRAKKQILHFIQSRKLTVGDRLPTETELSEQLDIGRLTLREALNALKSDGLIHSVQGRGTFVTCQFDHIANSLNINCGVTEMIETAGYRPGVASIRKKLVKADAAVARSLHIPEGTDVLMCGRIRLADDIPVVYSMDYLSPRLAAPFLGVTDENISLYAFIEDTCGIQMGVCMTELKPVIADKAAAELLDVLQGSPLLRMLATVNDVFGAPLIYADELFRPDKFEFIVSRGR